MTIKLADIFNSLASEFEARLVGDPEILIQRLSTLEQSTALDLTFLSNPKYVSKLAQSSAACVVVAPSSEAAAIKRGACIIVDEPYVYFARITQIW